MLVYQYLKFSLLGQRDVISFLSYLMLAVEFVMGFRNVSIIVILDKFQWVIKFCCENRDIAYSSNLYDMFIWIELLLCLVHMLALFVHRPKEWRWTRYQERGPSPDRRDYSRVPSGLPWRGVLWKPRLPRTRRVSVEIWQFLFPVAVKDTILQSVL